MRGGPGQDILLGNEGDDAISGARGGDLVEGGAGVDRLDGGSGADYASYFEFGSAVTIDLAAGTATGADSETERDTLGGIEDVLGGPHDDTIIGDDGPNALRGDVGGDTISGAGGNDILLADCFGGGGQAHRLRVSLLLLLRPASRHARRRPGRRQVSRRRDRGRMRASHRRPWSPRSRCPARGDQ